MSMGPSVHAARASRQSSVGTKPLNSRHSMMPTIRRKSSVGIHKVRQSISGRAMGGSTGIKSDPRPLSDKAYMHQEIRNLIRFLSDHNYDHSLSPKILLRPSGKDFQNILQFLFQHIQPNFRFGQKFIDEAPIIFKGLCYPFNISKTSLSAVGSPHTWPSLLGFLTWLTELLEYNEQREELEESKQESMYEEKMFFNYLREAYQCFLCGDDEMYDKLDMELVASYEQRDEDIKLQTETILENNTTYKQNLEDILNQKSLLPNLKSRKRDYESDLLKFQELIANLVEHKSSLESKTREYELDLEERRNELRESQQVKSQYQHKLDAQEISPADVERMNMERRRLSEAMEQLMKDREDIQQKTWEVEMQLSRKTDELEAAVKKYNEAAARLKLVPSTSQNAQGIDFEMRLDNSAHFRGDSLISIDLKNTIRPSLHELKEIAIRKTHEYRTRSLELQAQVDQNEEERSEKLEAIHEMEAKLKKANDQYQYDKESMDRQLHKSAVDTENIETQIHHLRMQENTAGLLEQTIKDIGSLSTTIVENKLKFRNEEVELEEQIHKSLDFIVEHKQMIEQMLGNLETETRENLNMVETATKENTNMIQQLITGDEN